MKAIRIVVSDMAAIALESAALSRTQFITAERAPTLVDATAVVLVCFLSKDAFVRAVLG